MVNRPVWRFSMLLGIVWARGHALRANALPLQQRFSLIPAVTERLVLRPWLSRPQPAVDARSSDWLDLLQERLSRTGRATVSLPHDKSLLARVMCGVTTQPVQMEYLNVYPSLKAVRRSSDGVELDLELMEAC